MLRLDFQNIEELESLHYDAVEDYVKGLSGADQDRIYGCVILLSGFENFPKKRTAADYSWLRCFILADISKLRNWVTTQADELLFMDFHELYGKRFSNGLENFVDTAGTYNAYKLIEKMGIHVCPYCDDEYMDTVEVDGKKKRTSEIDHFFPEGKTKYPALAMCFYNLVLSGQNCNGLKKQELLGVSPYESDIENQTCLYPDLPVGVNMEVVNPKDCKVKLHAKRGMAKNEKVLGLADRYAHRYREAYMLLKRKQQCPDDKIDELIRMGLYPSKEAFMETFFGPAYEEGKLKEIHQKMKHDIIGY